MYYSFYL